MRKVATAVNHFEKHILYDILRIRQGTGTEKSETEQRILIELNHTLQFIQSFSNHKFYLQPFTHMTAENR